LEGGANQSQRAGGVWIAQEALIFPPASVSLPMAAFAAPVRLNHLRHAVVRFGVDPPTSNKMAGELFFAGGQERVYFLGTGSVA
jgi:hypothetical protein